MEFVKNDNMNFVTVCKIHNSLLEERGLELLYTQNRNILIDQMEYLSKMLPDHCI